MTSVAGVVSKMEQLFEVTPILPIRFSGGAVHLSIRLDGVIHFLIDGGRKPSEWRSTMQTLDWSHRKRF
jgi:hypothetical protein